MYRIDMVIGSAMLILVATAPTMGQSIGKAESTQPLKVSITVSCDDQALQSRVYSHFHRYLRHLDGVRVVPKTADPDYEIRIIVLQGATAGGILTQNYSMSTVLTQPLDPFVRDGLIQDGLRGHSLHLGGYLNSGSLRSLDEACESLVAGFDGECFQFRRESQER